MRSPRVGPWGPNVRGDVAARGAPGVAVEPVSCGVMDAGPPCGGGRGQAASVHIRSGGRDRQGECVRAKTRRCPSLLAPTELVPAPSLVVLIGAERVTPPVPLLDLLDFLFAEPEVVADFVNEGLADGSANLVLGFVVCFDGTLEQRDAIGERIAVLPGAFRQRNSLVQTVERPPAARSPSPRGVPRWAPLRPPARGSASHAGSVEEST